MTKFREILQDHGLTDEQVDEIDAAFKENNIHFSKEEKIDERYEKLKGQHEGTEAQLAEAQGLIEQLKESAAGSEALSRQIADYEAKLAELEAENDAKVAELESAKAESDLKAAIKIAALKHEAKDAGYIEYRLMQDSERLKLNEQGGLVDEVELFKELKTESPDQFKAEAQKTFVVKKHGKDDPTPSEVTNEQFKKMGYESRLKLKSDNPELYERLTNKEE